MVERREWKGRGGSAESNHGHVHGSNVSKLCLQQNFGIHAGNPLRPSNGGAAPSSSGRSNVLSDWDAEVVPSLREFHGTAESIGGDVSRSFFKNCIY